MPPCACDCSPDHSHPFTCPCFLIPLKRHFGEWPEKRRKGGERRRKKKSEGRRKKEGEKKEHEKEGKIRTRIKKKKKSTKKKDRKKTIKCKEKEFKKASGFWFLPETNSYKSTLFLFRHTILDCYYCGTLFMLNMPRKYVHVHKRKTK